MIRNIYWQGILTGFGAGGIGAAAIFAGFTRTWWFLLSLPILVGAVVLSYANDMADVDYHERRLEAEASER